MQAPQRLLVHGKPSRQFAMSLDHPVLNGIAADDRRIAVRRLARLLMEASSTDFKEIGDDER
jgi:3,4-dihydroxy-2-butanone 4-phosphate synthase